MQFLGRQIFDRRFDLCNFRSQTKSVCGKEKESVCSAAVGLVRSAPETDQSNAALRPGKEREPNQLVPFGRLLHTLDELNPTFGSEGISKFVEGIGLR